MMVGDLDGVAIYRILSAYGYAFIFWWAVRRIVRSSFDAGHDFRPILWKWAIPTVVITLLLIAWGGIVHMTGSSLACPDWPLCYGQVFPRMQGGILIEHGHRMIAGLVGLLTIIIFVLARHGAHAGHIGFKRLTLLALVLVVVQVTLGGITVIYRLPTLISTAHLSMSMLVVASFWAIALKSRAPGHADKHVRRGFALAVVTALLVYSQIIIGGMVRHTGANIVCTELLSCNGSLWPTDPIQTQFHMAHRYYGVFVTLFVAVAALWWLRSRRQEPWTRRVALLMLFLAPLQVGLGLVSVAFNLDMVPVTGHLLVAALLLLGQVSLAFLSRRQIH